MCVTFSQKTKYHSPPINSSAWKKLPDVPFWYSSVSVVDGILLAIGGEDESHKVTSTICAFHLIDKKWQRVGNLPFECSFVDSLLLSSGELLVIDGKNQRALKVEAKGGQ